VFICHLIDPFTGRVEHVRDGFDRAPMLLGTDRIDLTSLWSAPFDSESSVDMIAADEAALDMDSLDTSFKFSLTCQNHSRIWQFVGRTVLVAVGDIPKDIAEQIRTPEAVAAALSFSGKQDHLSADVIHWSAQAGFVNRRAPVRRGPQLTDADRSSRQAKK
jgi:hypothetical protein